MPKLCTSYASRYTQEDTPNIVHKSYTLGRYILGI